LLLVYFCYEFLGQAPSRVKLLRMSSADGANEPVLPASEMKDALKRIKQLEAALGRRTLDNEFFEETVECGKKPRVNCAHALVA